MQLPNGITFRSIFTIGPELSGQIIARTRIAKHGNLIIHAMLRSFFNRSLALPSALTERKLPVQYVKSEEQFVLTCHVA